MEENKLLEEVKKACDIIEQVDEVITNNLMKCQHSSEDFKTNQRISNALLNVMQAINKLKNEL